LVREHGLSKEVTRALIAPAIGTKWLTIAGLDRALLAAGFFAQRSEPMLLLGASAGAWRALALAARDPLAAHLRLSASYCAQTFVPGDGPQVISGAYRRLLQHVLDDADIAHALAHPALDLGILVARGRAGTASDVVALQGAALGLAGALNAISRNSARLFFERTLFASAHGERGPHPLLAGLRAARVTLTADNARDALLASGTVPLYMEPVRDPEGAPAGGYIDGGLTDYHVNQPLDLDGQGVALMFLHQARLVPAWFDKLLPWRAPARDWLRDVLLVHPEPSWIASLPGGKVPSRDDFKTFAYDPEARIASWRTVVERSAELGEQLREDLERGTIAGKLEVL
jgi:hypothetical protein